VHAFAQSPIGVYFFSFLAIGIARDVYLILSRLEYLKTRPGSKACYHASRRFCLTT
jgi:hypothetical protein